MASLRILVPDDTINYVTNPSLRYDSTGWSSFGSTISRSLEQARFGVASLKVITNGTVNNEGAYFRVNALAGVSTPLTASVYVRGTGTLRLRLIDNPNGKQWTTKAMRIRPDRWMRLDVTGFSTGSNDLRMYVENGKSTPQAITFYVDGAQMERKAYSTTYCDGDQKDCRWAGSAHASASSRSKFSRAGGRWVALAGPEQEEQDLYMTVLSGLGSAPVSNITNRFSNLPGSYFQETKTENRVFIISFHAKHKDLRFCPPAVLTKLHALRSSLFDIIKPDSVSNNSEFTMEYQDGEFPMYVRARYEAGLEGEWDVRNGWINSFPVRFLSVSPYLFEDDQEVTTIDFQDSALLNNVAGRIDGAWSRMNYGFNGNVNDFEVGSRGELIAVGAFTVANNSALADTPLASALRIASWDGVRWSPYGSGANAPINDCAVAPNGYVYVTGEFTNIGGVACNYVAYWNGSTWNAMGTGLNGFGFNIQVAPNGNVYVAGTFTQAGGNNAYRIARWTGAAWAPLGAYAGMNGDVYSITISADGNTLYCGGSFTDQFGSPGSATTRVAAYNTLTGLFTALGNGFNATVRDVILSPTGVLYACGDFTLSGSETISYISQWNGSSWISLSSGMNATVNSLAISSNGDIVAGGAFTQAGSVTVKKLALWNGSAWVGMDMDIGIGSGVVEIYAVQFLPNGDLFLGGTLFSQSLYSSRYAGITTITNVGSTEAYPNFYILGPGTLTWIENQVTKKRLFLNLVVLSGEEVFIDISKRSIFSSIRGQLLFTILPGSDFRAMTLLPGENKFAIFMENDVAAVMQCSYIPQHWSTDYTQPGDAF